MPQKEERPLHKGGLLCTPTENSTTMKRIAIVTGASRGLGAAFVSLLRKSVKVDEIWLIARHNSETHHNDHQTGPRLVPICCDLTTETGRKTVERRLTEEPLHIDYLVNNAGMARFGLSEALTPAEISDMLTLNCLSLTSLCAVCIPHMVRGAHIINIASIAAFLPVPEMSVYAATKAYVLRYSLALRRELTPRGISVTTVCPGWMNTDFIPSASAGKNHIPTRFVGITTPERVAAKAWRDTQHGKTLSICGTFPRLVHWASRLLPHSWLMTFWRWQQPHE